MPERATAQLREQGGRMVLQFERVLGHEPERVWDALTVAGELAAWHPSPFELEPRVGGTVTFIPSPGIPSMPPGSVLAYEPPRRLAYTWGEDELRFEVHDHPGGSRLTLAHVFDDRFKAARDAAGWDLCLQALDLRLRGEQPGADEDGRSRPGAPGRIPPGWRELNDDYQRRFGIAPQDATPPPPDPA